MFNYYERQRQLAARRKLKLRLQPRVFANIGQGHEDYGMTPAEHMMARDNRTADSKAKPHRRSLLSRMLGR